MIVMVKICRDDRWVGIYKPKEANECIRKYNESGW